MSFSHADFESSLAEEISRYFNPEPVRKPLPPACPSQRETFVIRLAVRMKRLAIDDTFTYISERQSRLEAQIEAERAARAAGWRIVGHIHSIERL